jgi:nucleotidyltransferase/DNA polymerase involved in DNA repair
MLACAFIPRFELCLLAKGRPELWNEPLAVADFAAKPPRIKAATPAAQRLGVQVAQLCSQVRASCPEVSFVAPDEELLAREKRAILLALGELSPLLDTGDCGVFFLGLAGLEKIYPSELDFGRRVQQRLAQLGYRAQVAIAERPFSAWVLARQDCPTPRCLSGADEPAFLRSLPLSLLDLPEPTRQLCELLGVRTAGDLLVLPQGSLARRLGPAGADLERLCRGEGLAVWPQAAKVPTLDPRVDFDLDLPEESREPLLFLIKSLLDRLLAEVAQTRRALSELTLRLKLDDHSECARIFPAAEASLRVTFFLDLIRLWLEGHPLPRPVTSLSLVATRTAPAGVRQLQLFHRKEERSKEALSTVLNRLRAAFGGDAVVRPILSDVFRPEERLRWESSFDAGDSATRTFGPTREGDALVLDLLCEPRLLSNPPTAVEHEGPHRLSGEWWHRPFDRSYYWLALADGERLWIYRDEEQGGLFVQAVAD